MDYREKFAKIAESMETRKNNTSKARKSIKTIFNWINSQIDDEDSVTGYYTEKTFDVSLSSQPLEAQLGLRNGYARIFLGDLPVDQDELNYVNFSQFADALGEFLDKLAEISVFQKTTDKLQKAVEALS